MAQKEISAQFNCAADKVVAMKEWRAKAKALAKSNLSRIEKVLMNLMEKPLGAVVGLKTAAQIMTNPAVRDTYEALNADGSLGIYEDDDGEGYVSVATIQEMMRDIGRYTPNKKLQAKLTGFTVQAVEEAKDYAPDVTSGLLQPIVRRGL